jgi:Zn-dependent protease with chaperone function
MARKRDLFARRNRARITALVVLATLNYMLAVALAAVAVALGILVAILFEGGIVPDDTDTAKWIGIGIAAILALAFVVGLVLAIVKIPFARRSLERRVLRETAALVATPEDHREMQNLLEGLAIASDIPAPRFAVIDDPAPNSFGVGTRPRTRSSA